MSKTMTSRSEEVDSLVLGRILRRLMRAIVNEIKDVEGEHGKKGEVQANRMTVHQLCGFVHRQLPYLLIDELCERGLVDLEDGWVEIREKPRGHDSGYRNKSTLGSATTLARARNLPVAAE